MKALPTYAASTVPVITGLEIHVFHRPAEEASSGDWFDVVAVEDDLFFIVVGDAMGHGREASLKMPALRDLLEEAVRRSLAPGEALSRANGAACEARHESVFSALIASYRPSTRSLSVATAGHPAPILARARDAAVVPVAGMLLGVDPEARYEERASVISQGDRILLYTDGLIEANRRPIESEQLLIELLAHDASLAQIVATLLSSSPGDDVAALLITPVKG